MSKIDYWGIEWVVAFLAPWTISPHPNFRPENLTAAAQLALVAESREMDWRSDESIVLDSQSGWEERLVENARASLSLDTQLASVEPLTNISGDTDVLPGARCAAAVFASVALCEMERHDEAVHALGGLVADLRGTLDNPAAFLPSQRLILATTLLHLATRLVECFQLREAKLTVAEVLHWLPRLDDTRLEEFEPSRGVSWGSATIQRDILRSVKHNAMSLKSHLEAFNGETWVQVVRARRGWVDLRLLYRSADRDGVVLRDAFERRIEATSNAHHFGRLTSDAAGYRSLLLAELSGNLGLMREEREKLGKILVLERGEDPERMREALRLLRQSLATKALKSVVSWLRSQGPTTALIEDAKIIVDRVQRLQWCTEQDLLVLEGASDFLSVREKDQAISAALVFTRTAASPGVVSWTAWERLWKTIAQLVPESSRQDQVAGLAIDSLRERKDVNQSYANTLARLVSRIDWDQVASERCKRWMEWAREAEPSLENKVLIAAVEENICKFERQVPEGFGIERAAFLSDKDEISARDHETIPEIFRYLSQKLRSEASDARNGRISYGGYQTLNVAVAFVLRFDDAELWEAIVDYILDPDVDRSLKTLGIDRLAENAHAIPRGARVRIKESIHALLGSSSKISLFERSESTVFAEGMRLSAVLGAQSKSSILAGVMKLTSSTVKDRIEAAKTIPFCLQDSDATWGHALLLQLSYDSDPNVRAASGHALVRSSGAKSDLTESLDARVNELLVSDGIRVPLAVLHALQRETKAGASGVERFFGKVASLAESGASYVIRGAAQICLGLYRGREE